MIKPKNFIATVQHKVAITAIGPSALRGNGEGVLKASQRFLATVPLARIPKSNSHRFRRWLDCQTEALLDQLPISGRPWGAARKAINLFLRDALYNQYLCREFKMWRIEPWLEVPLDSVVAGKLKSAAGRGILPRWKGLKNLQIDESDNFQDFAIALAKTIGIKRVHMDIYLWLQDK